MNLGIMHKQYKKKKLSMAVVVDKKLNKKNSVYSIR